MLESVLRNVENRILVRENSNTWKTWYGPALFIFFVVLTAAVSFVPLSAVQVTVGGLCGAGIFIAGYIIWYTNLPIKYNIMLDVRGNYPVLVRRRIAIGVVLGWLIILIFFHNFLPQPVAGAFTVAVILTCWHLGTATEEERAYLDEIGEEWLEAEKARKKAKQEAKMRRQGIFTNINDNDWDDGWDDDSEEDTDDDWDDKPRGKKRN